jgi:ubiquinone/menaquinone biosynthesis C-methylase UbiE
VPDLYDDLMVPMIFLPYAKDVAARVVSGPCDAVLETAAGTGVLTRELAPRLPATAGYVVTDLSQPMLDRARLRQPADPRIVWQVADAMALPFPVATFDVVCCQFGAMFFPDRVAGFAETRRLLKPGGRYIASVWDALDANPLSACVDEVLNDWFGGTYSQFFQRLPHGYHDLGRIEADFRAAGFASVQVEPVDKVATAPSAASVAQALCMGTPVRNEIVVRDPDGLEAVTARATKAVEARFGKGPISAPIRAIVITASG